MLSTAQLLLLQTFSFSQINPYPLYLFQSSDPCQDTVENALFSISVSYESENNSLQILSKLCQQNSSIWEENDRILKKKKVSANYEVFKSAYITDAKFSDSLSLQLRLGFL